MALSLDVDALLRTGVRMPPRRVAEAS